jgi:mannosyltransferase
MSRQLARVLLLLLVLVAFARLVYRLGDKNLWLDEAFSLQRAEASWPALILGDLAVGPELAATAVTDTHPFVFYGLLKLALPFVGTSEFGLRWLPACAATVLVPLLWSLSRRLVRLRAVPPGAPWWAASLAAASPFYLWYGQEARMYAPIALFAALSTYLLLAWSDSPPGRLRMRYLAGYGISLALLLGSHYLSLLILPVHAVLVYQSLSVRSRRRGLVGAAAVLACGLAPGGVAVWQLVYKAGSVAHFASVSFSLLIRDVLHSFTVGQSADANRFLWLELIYGALVVGGAAWGWLHRRPGPNQAWLLPTWLLAPMLLLAALNLWRPAYMNSREMSVISPAFVLSLAGGFGWLWQRNRVISVLISATLLVFLGYSTVSYYTDPNLGKGDMSSLGRYVENEIQPGDVLITEPSHWWRLFQYYLPVDALGRGAQTGAGTGWRSMPVPGQPWGATAADLEMLTTQFRRIWLARTEPHSRLADWLAQHTCRVRGENFPSPITFIRAELYVPMWPVLTGSPAPGTIQRPAQAVFGDGVRFLGYSNGQRLAPDAPVPLTLYWQAAKPLAVRYKYRIDLIANKSGEQVAVTDREFNSGCRPTPTWQSGSTMVEYTAIQVPKQRAPGGYHLELIVYDADTLDRLPVMVVAGASRAADGETLILPALP